MYGQAQIDPNDLNVFSDLFAGNGNSFIRLVLVDLTEAPRPGASLREIEAADHICYLLELKRAWGQIFIVDNVRC